MMDDVEVPVKADDDAAIRDFATRFQNEKSGALHHGT